MNPQLREAFVAHDWAAVAGYYWWALGVLHPAAHTILLVLGVLLLLAFPPTRWLLLLPLRGYWKLLRSLWPFGKPRVPWNLGSVVIDLKGGRDTLHTVVGGMSGTGKSSVVLPLLLALWAKRMPALVVAFDNSRPIRLLFEVMGWTIWTTRGTLGWNILDGEPQVVSEALTAGFARTSGDTGYYRGLARLRIWKALEAMDSAGVPRDIWLLIEAMRVRAGDSDEDRACRAWANRFESIARSLGPALGRDLDLAQAMRQRKPVLMLPNRFLSPEDAPLVGAMALVQARRVAQEVGDFVCVVEEAGQASGRQSEISPLSQAARDRGVPLVILTQNMALLPREVVNNTSVWLSFAQEEDAEVRFAVARMKKVPLVEDFDRDYLPTGWCWVKAPGVSPRRTYVKLPKLPVAPPHTLCDAEFPNSNVTCGSPDVVRVRVFEVLPEPVREPEPWALPAPSARCPEWLEGHGPLVRGPLSARHIPLGKYVWLGCSGTEYDEAHWLWTGPTTDEGDGLPGYPRVAVFVLDPIDGSEVRKEFRGHKIAYEAWQAANPDVVPELGPTGTTGHMCPGPAGVAMPDRRCINAPRHLQRQSYAEGTKERWQRQKARTGSTRLGQRQKKAASA